MPVFNEEFFLEECLLSIINQDFKNWELIAVDDFSTDKSLEVLGQYHNLDDRITVLRNDKKGIIPALRMAFAKAQGVMVTRMDADDVMPIEKLTVLSNALASYGSGHVVSGKVKYFSKNELGQGFLSYEKWINKQVYYKDIYKECTLPSACWMAYRSDLEKISAFTSSRYPEDYDLLFRFYQHGIQIKGSDQVLHLWRDHPDRASRNDPNYADQNFFPLKVAYFKLLDYDDSKELVLWGAGRKGKALARILIDHGLKFRWITDNEKKIGKHIYEVLLEHTEMLIRPKAKQVITAISDSAFLSNKSEIMSNFNGDQNQFFEFC